MVDARARTKHGLPDSIALTVAILIAAMLALQAIALWLMDQPAIAKSGTIELWHGAADDGQSQHIADWYTLTHIEHGLVFYLLLLLLLPRVPLAWRLVLAFAIEGLWEVFENTDLIIDRYRESNLAQGYRGDTIVNSISDTLAMALGFVVAALLPVWVTLALFLGIETVLALGLRDNLILNVLNLIHPFEAIQQWQGAGT